MAPHVVLAATALLTTLSLSSAYDSNYGNSLYARSYDEDASDFPLHARSVQKILARRAALEELEDTPLHTREPCGPGCLCGRHMAAREADPEADPVEDALFEHDDILFNYRRDINSREAEADAEADPIADALFEHDDILFNYRRGINSREADPDADPIGDAIFEHDDILFNYKRDIDARDADADPIADPLFEHDDILFNYKRDSEDSYFDNLEFFDIVSRRDINAREAEADAEAEADPIADALFEHDDILFNYRRSTDDPFDELEFTDLVARQGYTPWFQSEIAQSRKSEYKSPGALKAESAAKSRGGDSFSGVSNGAIGTAGGLGGNAFNEALDASSGGATSMDAASMDAGGLGV